MSLYIEDEYQSLKEWMVDADDLMHRLRECIEESAPGASAFIEQHARAELVALVQAFEKVRAPTKSSQAAAVS